ncbi:MAG: cadherin-like beta sandwich domain-containing protein [Bacilli bacterium]|jgi:hypothetical protein|nr:cadherin-like beta sandwich domain-containing protein [Bacilli bacterium]
MKKTNYLLLFIFTVLITFIFNIETVNAVTGTFSVKASSTNVLIGNNVKITVTVSSAAPIGAWEFVLNYDSSILKLISSTPNTYIVDYGDGTKKSASYTYTFKTLKTGKTTVAVRDAAIIDYDNETEMAITKKSTTVTVSKPVIIEKSSNANLKELLPSKGTLSPSFDPNITEYDININELIDKFIITANPEDDKSSIIGDGEVTLTEGINVFEIKVTAEDGTTKTYTINTYIIDENPIEVNINGNKYTIIKNTPFTTVPHNYIQTSIPINGIEVVAYENNITKFILIALKNKDGESSLFIYDPNQEKYTKYNEINNGIMRLYLSTPPTNIKIPNNYKPTKTTINNIEIEGWVNKQDNAFLLVYAMNVTTGEYNLYSYDKTDEVFQRFNNNNITIKDLLQNYLPLLIMTAITIVILISIVVIQLFTIKKIKNSLNKKKV